MSQDTQKKSRFMSFWAIGLGITLFLITSLYLTNNFIGIDNFSNYISLPLYTIIPGVLVLLGILSLLKSKIITNLPRISLLFLVFSFSFSFGAEQLWNLYEHVLDIDPYPSIADFFYLGAPILMFFSLVLFLKPVRDQISKTNIFFACTISVTLLIPTVILTYTSSFEDEPFEIFVALLYPIVDSVLLIPAIIAILFSVTKKQNFFLIMILAGIIVLIAADTIFLFLIIDDTYFEGHPVEILWITSYSIWAFMLYYLIYNSKYQNKEDPSEKQNIGKFGTFITLILVNGSIGIILVGMNYFMGGNSENNILAFFSWFLIMIVVIFSSIILFLNSKLSKALETKTIKLDEISDELIKSERFSAIGTLSSRLAHDLRNPLGVIHTSNTLIKTKSSDESISKNTERINRAVKRMTHQIENVLDFVRIKPLSLNKIPIHKLIDDAMLSIDIPEGISVETPSNNPHILCDEEQFLIVMYNIIINAVQKLGDNGNITIIYDNDDLNHIIKIQDSGESISDTNIEKIFEPLFTTKLQGTGLGLASCKQIIEQHEGTISIENNPTTFIIKIPKKFESIV